MPATSSLRMADPDDNALRRTRGARWGEINAKKALWTIPRGRMKGRREHVVPLPARCLQILKAARTLYPNSELLSRACAQASHCPI